MSKKVYILGGRQKDNAASLPEWYNTEEGVIYELDLDSEDAKLVYSYKGRLECRAEEEASVTFKSGYFDKEKSLMYVCTLTEVLVLSIPDFSIKYHISLPIFNDLHYVRPFKEGSLLVVSTGLDLVVEVDFTGNILNEWSSLPDQDTWKRFDGSTDYRKVATTKPHLSHPNFVSLYKDEIWVTRFEQKDALCLSDISKRIPIDVERPHDGFLFNSLLYYTTVDGYVVIGDPERGSKVDAINLNSIGNPLNLALGWCRGLEVYTDEYVVVGFSTIRHTKFKNNLNWLNVAKKNLHRLAKKKTRVAVYDLKNKQLIKEINLEKQGINVLFSVLSI